jgi:hypothetical protein
MGTCSQDRKIGFLILIIDKRLPGCHYISEILASWFGIVGDFLVYAEAAWRGHAMAQSSA